MADWLPRRKKLNGPYFAITNDSLTDETTQLSPHCHQEWVTDWLTGEMIQLIALRRNCVTDELGVCAERHAFLHFTISMTDYITNWIKKNKHRYDRVTDQLKKNSSHVATPWLRKTVISKNQIVKWLFDWITKKITQFLLNHHPSILTEWLTVCPRNYITLCHHYDLRTIVLTSLCS